MSSCQDSMDTDDSIPRPEYEDIVPGEEDDEKFWEEKSKRNFSPIENGTQQRKRETANIPPTDSSRSSPPSTTSPGSNSNQSFLGKDCDEPMEEDCEYDETSFDEADEKDEVDDKSCNTPVQSNEDPLEIRERVKEVVTPASITTDGTDSPVPHIKTGENKSTVLINLNGEIVMRRSSAKPSTSTPINPLSPGLTPEEEGISLVDQIKRSHLSQFKDERRRSRTPSRRGTREIMALQKSFTESKVLSEFVNEKERPRKSRKIPLKDATIIDDGERKKFNLFRARSKSLTKSNLRPIAFSTTTNSLQRWPSEGKLNSKRENMRSQNTDFVQKQMKFLNRVNQDDPMSDASEGEPSLNESIITGSLENKDDCWQPPPKSGADSFCWKCGKSSVAIACSKCPRSYHYKCVKVSSASKLDKVWICPECVNLEICINRLKISKKETLSVDMLNQLLLFALKRMKQVKGHEKLLDIPDSKDSPFYEKYVVNPVTLNTLQEKIEKKAFRCTEEFVLETKWIHHNISIASAAGNSKESLVAKALLKVCRQEAAEIETCPECYLNANSHGDWFVDVCLQPHILLWAKLKGFPFWPAKGMGLGPNNLVNVRFFGAHDRAFVPIKDCFLYSEIDPSPQSGKRPFRSGVAACIKEVNVHIQKIKEKIGGFNFAPVRTQYDPVNEMIQLEEMMPGVTEYIKRQQTLQKPPLTYKIVKTAGNNLSFIKKPDSGTESDHSSLGAERNQKRSRSSTQSPKPSPLSEVKKPKELQNSVQSTQLKSSPIPKNSGNKSLSSNYEVVAKPGGKDESNSSKINSVILKRKSDVVLVQPNVKKSRSSEGNSGQETPTPKQEKPEIKPEQKKEPAVIPPVVFQCESEEPASEQGQCPEQFPNLDTSTPITMGKETTTTTATCDMEKLIQNRQGVTIKKVSKKQSGLSSFFTVLSEKTSKNTSDEKIKADTETGIQINTSQQTIAKVVVQPSKCIQSPPNPAKSPPKPNQSPPKSNDSSSKPVSAPPKYIPSFPKPAASPPKSVSSPPKPISSPPKPVSSPPKPPSSSSSPKHLSTPSRSVLMPLKSVSIASVTKQSPIATLKYVQTTSNPTTPAVEKPSHPKGLIPFEDIKQEKLDEELLPIKQSKSAKKAVDPLAKTPNGSTSNSSSPKSSTGNSQLDISQLPIPVNIDLIKQENNSDEFPSINSTSSQCKLNPSTALTKTQVTFKSTEQPALTGDNNLKQRLVVRSIESLTMKSTPTKSVTSDYMTSLSTTATSTIITATTTTSGQPKKANARARKSFPNKGPNATTVMLPPEIGRSLTKNSMVFIPVDSQNAVPIQPLTAVSKPTNHNQTVAKVTSSLPITTSNTAQNNSTLTITTSASTLPPFTVIPASTSSTPASVTVSAALTNSTISVSATVTGVSSALATYRPSNVSTVKTLSPLQLTVQPVPTPALETENTSDKNREAEGHILSGIVTPSLAAAITNTIVRGPPKLAPRPNGALRSYGNYGFNSEAGPVCRTLVENAHKMTDFFISVMQDTVNDMASADVLQAKVAALQMELETKVATYEKQLYELKQNTDTMLCEMKKSMETERMRIIAETRQQCEIERIHAVEQTKRRQWCACCGREANSYCCWNTAYCNTNCQATDWLRHKLHCCQVNPHLNPELQGPGILFSAPNLNTAPSTITTTTDQMISCTAPSYMPHQPVQILRTGQSTTASIPSSSSVQTATATTIQKKSGSPSSAGTSTSASATSSTTIDMAYKNKEVLKLPPNTYLRPLQPSMRFPSPSVHRFNISVPITSGTTGGAPIKLVQREGTWELMSVPHPSSTVIPQLSSYKQQQQQQQQQLQQHQQQPPRLINNSLTANLPKDSRTLGSVMVRSNQM